MFSVGNLQMKSENKWKWSRWSTLTTSLKWLLRFLVYVFGTWYMIRQISQWVITGLGFVAVSLNFLCHHFVTQISGCYWFLCREYWGLFQTAKWPEHVDLLCSFVILRYDITSTSVSSWCGRKSTLWLSGMFLRWEVMDTNIMSDLYERKMITKHDSSRAAFSNIWSADHT